MTAEVGEQKAMGRIRIDRVLVMTSLVSLVVGGVFLGPLAIRTITARPTPEASATEDRNAAASRYYMENHLVDRGRDPIAWDCGRGQPTRVRYFKNTCFAEHIIEFETLSDGSDGRLTLTARDQAEFLGKDGARLVGQHYLDASRSQALVTLLARRMPELPSLSSNWQMPQYQSAIEACISGKSLLLVRAFESDQQFEQLARELTALAGVKLSRKNPNNCM